MRDKEKLHDYRFMPEPNLPPLLLYNDLTQPPGYHGDDQVVNIDELRRKMPLLPSERRERLKKKYDLSQDNINTIMVSFQNNYLQNAYTI